MMIKDIPRDNLLSKFSHIMDALRDVNRSMMLKVLVARQFPQYGNSDLHLLNETSIIEPILHWKTVGNGSPTADRLVRGFLKREERTYMKNFAKLGHNIIKFIENTGCEQGVGVGENTPSIKYLEHGADLDVEPNSKDFVSFDVCYDSYEKEFQTILENES